MHSYLKYSVVFVFAFLVIPSFANAETASLLPAQTEVQPSTEFSLNINISSVSNVFGIAFDLIFDPSRLEFVNASEGALFNSGCSTSFMSIENPPGTLIVGLSRLGANCGGISSSGTALTLTFRSKTTGGATNLSFSNNTFCVLQNSECNFVTGTWIPATVNVSGGSAPVATAYSLSISKNGAGSGTVSGGSISCGGTCSQSNIANGTIVTLTATPASGSSFSGWGGLCSGTASTCTITINNNASVTATFTALSTSSSAPSITAHPTNQTVTAGRTTTFSVVAISDPAPSYWWQKNGVNISGATSASYTTPTLTKVDNNATYRVVVSNPKGSVTSNSATLIVTDASTTSTQENTTSENTSTAGSSSTSQGQTTAYSPAPFTLTLAFGQTNSQVSLIQDILNIDNHLKLGDAKGFFGSNTMEAIKAFQCKQNIVCSGNATASGYGAIGPKTRDALNSRYLTLGGQEGINSKLLSLESNTAINENIQDATLSEEIPACPDALSRKLSCDQVGSILDLLRAFNADETVIDNVNRSLLGYEIPSSSPVSDAVQVSEFPSVSSHIFTEWLLIGSRNQAVRNLQIRLNQLGYTIAQTGVDSTGSPRAGSPGNETDYFGPSTRSALQRFQCDRLSVCSGTPATTGYGATGPRTRAVLNRN